MEISGGDFNHPVVERFCHDMVSAQIRAENIVVAKRFLYATVIIGIIFFMIYGALFFIDKL
jgi:hypothetical protein